MMNHLTQGQLIIPNENFGLNPKKSATDGKGKSSKTIHKKSTAASGRKALNDITNKSTLRQAAAPLRKQEGVKEEVDVAGERFLHDHDKCIEAQKVTMNDSYLDLVLPGHDSLSKVGSHISNEAKIDIDVPGCCTIPDELLMQECNNWWKYSAKQPSPPCSPIRWDSPSTSFSRQFEELNFILRE